MSVSKKELLTVGWREWVRLPELNLPPIKVKVDTGARTSALHAFDIKPFVENGKDRIEFSVQPIQRNKKIIQVCQADVFDQRIVSDSGGHRETRWVIQTMLTIGGHSWPIEVTLTARNSMRFRMLLGRTALENRALVNVSESYFFGDQPRRRQSQTT